MKTDKLFPDIYGARILLAGDISRAFSDPLNISGPIYQVHNNMLDAADAAARENFSTIGVVMSGASSRLTNILKVLRENNPAARIVLLAQMYEESAAMQLVNLTSNGASLADSYLICPVKASQFYEISMQKPAEAAAAAVDKTTQARMKILEKLATEDELTGLKNRRYLWEFCRQIIERAKKEHDRVTLLVFDIDYFKHYNDTYGHSVGDEILKQTAALIRRCCRPHDVVGRIGGDEFAVVFWDDPKRKSVTGDAERRSSQADHPKEVISIAKRFRKELERTKISLLDPGDKGALAISGGLASFPRDGSTAEEIFVQADNALLDAKRSGKNRIYLVGKSQNDIANLDS